MLFCGACFESKLLTALALVTLECRIGTSVYFINQFGTIYRQKLTRAPKSNFYITTEFDGFVGKINSRTVSLSQISFYLSLNQGKRVSSILFVRIVHLQNQIRELALECFKT
jgi:hypothetical protein